MHKAFVIVPLVGWAGIAALVHYTPFSFPSKANEGTVVVVPSRSAEATGRAPVAQGFRTMPPAGNRAALVRELQKELTRVGCYDGEISGAWTTSSRRAMRDFTDRVNAKLPIDEPDHILLSLVQGHRQKACGIACAAGQQEGPDGRCVPGAIAARAAKQPAPPGVRADAPAQASPVITGSTTTAAAVAAVAAAVPQTQRSAPPPPAKQAYVQPPPAAADTENLAKSAAKSGPVPSLGTNDPQRRQARRAKSRPPAVVRSLVRSVKNALGIR